MQYFLRIWNVRRSMTLSAKMSLGYAVVVLIFSSVSVFNHVRLGEINAKEEELDMLSGRQQTAIALRSAVERMDAIAAGYLLTGEPGLAEQYAESIPEMSGLIESVGASAGNADQRLWRSRLKTVSLEFVANFERAIAAMTNADTDSTRKQAQAETVFRTSQLHKQVMFELVQSFSDSYTAEETLAREQLHVMIENNRAVIMQTSIVAAVVAVIVATAAVRSLISGVRRLRVGIDRVKEGDLSIRIGSASRAVSGVGAGGAPHKHSSGASAAGAGTSGASAGDAGAGGTHKHSSGASAAGVRPRAPARIANDELGRLSDSFDASVSSMRGMVRRSKEIAQSLREHSESFREFSRSTRGTNSHIVRAMEEIAAGASQQAEQTEQGVAAIAEMDVRVDSICTSAESLRTSSEEAMVFVGQGTQLVEQLRASSEQSGTAFRIMSEALARLEARSAEIAEITGSIQDISKQTHILALNAAIESARAGVHGRGFAVIADEVRQLSRQTTASSVRIDDILSLVRFGVQEAGVTLREASNKFSQQQANVGSTEHILSTIVQRIRTFEMHIQQIGERALQAKEQQRGLSQAIQAVASVAQETAASVEQTVAAAAGQDDAVSRIADEASDINALAESLFAEINKFKL